MQSAKTAYAITDDIPANVAIEQMVSKDPATGTIYAEIINNTAQDKTIQLDLTALTTSGTVPCASTARV